jgi:hypothetical protein
LSAFWYQLIACFSEEAALPLATSPVTIGSLK